MKIVDGEPPDIEMVVSVSESWRGCGPVHYSRTDGAKQQALRDRLESGRTRLLIAFRDSAPVGFAIFEAEGEDTAFINLIVVSKTSTSQGIGTLLVRELKTRYRCLRLANDAQEPVRAAEWYGENGFRCVRGNPERKAAEWEWRQDQAGRG